MNRISCRIGAFWDVEAEVWVATSEDVPGLATEAETLEALSQKLKTMVPELLQLNRVISDDQDSVVIKEIVKDALVEVLQEEQGFLYELMLEAIEDIALVRAIDKEKDSEPATREDIFSLLEQAE
jgi:predicted RNase H-like HicB family nuclease